MEESKDHKRANRLARAIASDISIYYGDKIKRGLENDNLFDEIKSELQEGIQLFRQKVTSDIVDGTNIFERAVIDIIIASRAHISTPIF